MTAYIYDWLSLLFRWGHLLAGIAWIGGSFLYVWIDNNLEKPAQWKADKGIKGDVWVIHGGGIYEFQKYELAPDKMPALLHWVKWESYFTWLTGILLLCFIYYGQAQSYLMSSSSIFQYPLQAVAASVVLLVLTICIYEALIRTRFVNNGPVFSCVMVCFFLLFSYVAWQLFPPRAAAIHLGIAIGTIMVGNVFLGIVPAQRMFLSDIEAGRQPNVTRAAFAKLRSTHNNYLTLPVLLCMISNHYPMLYSHSDGWWLMVAVAGISAYGRHYFNLKNRGVKKPYILLITAIMLIALIIYVRPITPLLSAATVREENLDSLGEKASSIVVKHCTSCHAAEPKSPMFNAPPAGVVIENVEQIESFADRIYTVSVQSEYMPLGNMSGMTQEEREALGRFILLSKAAKNGSNFSADDQ
ncbi:MAG: putative membrane protein [Oceanicoccus sp.]|jgi:uncharacterized membrane protein